MAKSIVLKSLVFVDINLLIEYAYKLRVEPCRLSLFVGEDIQAYFSQNKVQNFFHRWCY